MECFWWKFNLIRLSRENSFGKNRFRRTWERWKRARTFRDERKFSASTIDLVHVDILYEKVSLQLGEKQFQGKTKRLEKSTESCLARLKPLPSSGCFCWNSQRALRWEKETKQLQTRRLTQTKHEMKQKMTENREKIIMEKNETETKAKTCSRWHIISEAFVKPNQLI